MSQKIGRPKTENPKEIRFSVRLDAETDCRLQEYCSKHNVTKGKAIREGIQLLLAKSK